MLHNAWELLISLDSEAIELTQSLRWEPLTVLFTAASAWWVKGPVIAAIGACGDLKRGIGCLRAKDPLRSLLPIAAISAGFAFFIASALNALLKLAVARPRPPLEDSSVDAAVALPESFSFPSGHAMSAFAAATAVAVLRPSLRWPALGLAALIAMSRPYLGVHFWVDVIAGAALGSLCGIAVATLARRALQAQPAAQPA